MQVTVYIIISSARCWDCCPLWWLWSTRLHYRRCGAWSADFRHHPVQPWSQPGPLMWRGFIYRNASFAICWKINCRPVWHHLQWATSRQLLRQVTPNFQTSDPEWRFTVARLKDHAGCMQVHRASNTQGNWTNLTLQNEEYLNLIKC